MNCHVCQTELLPKAQFCHICGAPVRVSTDGCPSCGAERREGALVCHQCGHRFAEKYVGLNSRYPLHLNNAKLLQEDLKAHFFDFLKERLREEQDVRLYKTYLEHFFTSDFSRRFESRIEQCAREVESLYRTGDLSAQQRVEALLDRTFGDICDFFIIHYCASFNPIPLPEAMLEYANVERLEEVDLLMMILDFLDFENEEETVYTDFLAMPMEKLQQAAKQYLFPGKDEKILLICDQSLTGTGKEGFAFTEKALYWRMHFHPPQAVFYDQLRELVKAKDWITINGHFFNVNPTLNVKMLKLLRKMRGLFQG